MNHSHKKRIVKLARTGYAAKGVVYSLIGILAIQTALGTGGKTTGARGVLKEIASAPFGQILLILIAAGLAAYVAWRIAQSVLDPEERGSNFKSILIRIGFLFSGLIYSSIVFAAIKIVAGSSSGNDGEGQQQAAATVMEQPLGKWLVIAGGAIAVGAGLYQLYKGLSKKFLKKFNANKLNDKKKKLIKYTGIIGFSSRFVVFSLIGLFFIKAGINSNPKQAGGIEEAMLEILIQPHGTVLLGILAAGLFLYGFFMILTAKYRSF